MLEDMNGKFDHFLELFESINMRIDSLATNDRLDSMIQKQDAANAAIKNSFAIITNHRRRIAVLEQK